MAGSIKWMVYTSDTNVQFLKRIDESNGIAGGFSDLDGTEDPKPGFLPREIKMRYVNTYKQGEPIVKRRFYIGNPTLFGTFVLGTSSTLTAQDSPQGSSVTWVVTSIRGETATIAHATDTGQTDGTPQ